MTRLHSCLTRLVLGLFLAAGLLQAAPVVANEQAASVAYQNAKANISLGQFKQALQELRYLQRQYPNFSNIAGVKTRIAVLHEADIAGSELLTFLYALDERDAGNPDKALEYLRDLVIEAPSSSLVDDAIYLMAYVHLMERFDYDTARAHIAELKQRAPDTAYLDAADYLNAIAHEQSGQTQTAVALFTALRDRHTSMTLPFGVRVARGNVLSRYWFDRADRRLEILSTQRNRSSTLSKRNEINENQLSLSVLVGGVELDLVLQPSSLTQSSEWFDAQLRSIVPPSVGVYSGYVNGESDSWARVVLSNNDIHGVVMRNGKRHRLHPEDLIGTLDYYQPKNRAGAKIQLGGSEEELPLMLDSLPTPLEISNQSKRSSKRSSSRTDMQIVPMSVVIDSQYNRYYNGEALVHAINGLNVADAIYRPLGLTIRLNETIVHDGSVTDPMAIGPSTLEQMLRNFRDYRLNKRTLFSESGLVYLFTGNPKTDITLGLAWIDTACRTDGYDVGVTTPSSFTDVLLTHELGHSLGAQHDTDTECAGQNGMLMSPRISGFTATTMSTCSQSSIVNSRSRSCFLPALDLSLGLQHFGNTVQVGVTNNDSSYPASAVLDVEVDSTASVEWPEVCTPTTLGSAECRLSSIAPKSVAEISFPFASEGLPRLTAVVNAVGVLDATPANNGVALNMGIQQNISGDLVAVNTNSGTNTTFNSSVGTGSPVSFNSPQTSGGAMSWVWLASLASVLLGSAADRSAQRGFVSTQANLR